MPVSLMRSQFAALEEPGADERPVIASVERRPWDSAEIVLRVLGLVAPMGAATWSTGTR
jgi:gluconate kinase